MYKSKTIGLNRGSKFGFAESITFNPNGNKIIGNVNMIGDPSFYDTVFGKSPKNIETAIHDLATNYEDPIGTIRINTDGSNPQGQGAYIKITFDGTVTPKFRNNYESNSSEESSPGDDDEEMVTLSVFGVPVEVLVGANSEDVAEAFNSGASKLASEDKIYISSNIDSGDKSSVVVQTISNTNYIIPEEVMIGLNMKAKLEIMSPPKPGYGTWILIGKEQKEFEEFSEEFYYFKRIA